MKFEELTVGMVFRIEGPPGDSRIKKITYIYHHGGYIVFCTQDDLQESTTYTIRNSGLYSRRSYGPLWDHWVPIELCPLENILYGFDTDKKP